MKKIINKYSLSLFALVVLVLSSFQGLGQKEGKEIVQINYFNENNRIQYLILKSELKVGKTRTPIKGKEYQVFLDKIDTLLIAKLITDDYGKAKAFIPPNLKDEWNSSNTHTFIVKTGVEEVISDYVITKSKITIDTLNEDGERSILIKISTKENEVWIPKPDVEVKIGIKRQAGSILSAGDEEGYTTDSLGSVIVPLKKDKIPGDKNGVLILVARVDNAETMGTVSAEMKTFWGVQTKIDKQFFNKRTLWSTGNRTPIWLLVLACSITIGVWGTIIYLVQQILIIKKLGNSNSI